VNRALHATAVLAAGVIAIAVVVVVLGFSWERVLLAGPILLGAGVVRIAPMGNFAYLSVIVAWLWIVVFGVVFAAALARPDFLNAGILAVVSFVGWLAVITALPIALFARWRKSGAT
jgi:hypothetical protein